MSETVPTRTAPPPPTLVPPLAKWSLLSMAAVLGAVHLVAASFGGYWFDEAYMLAIGKSHASWGYADQPPLAPLVAAAMDWIAPGSVLAVRLPGVLATAAGVWVAGLTARELGGDRRAQVLTGGVFATALWVNLTGHWLTPYTIEPVQWMLLIWLLVRWIRLRDDRLLLALGCVAGIAAQTKFQAFLLCAVLLVSIAVAGPRELLRRPMLWGAVALAMLIAAPTLLWQALHGWPQLGMGAVAAAENPILYGGRPETAVMLLVSAGVAGTALVLYGMWRMASAPEFRPYGFLGITFVILFGFFVATLGRPYYLGGLYAAVAAVGAVGLQRRREARKSRWSWSAWPVYALSAATALSLVWTSTLPSLTGPFGENIPRETAEIHRALPPSTRAHTAIVAESYIVAAYIDVHARKYDVPTAYSPHRGYGYFRPPREETDSVLYIGSSAADLRPYFAEVRKVGTGSITTWFCTGKRESWSRIWPQLRSLA